MLISFPTMIQSKGSTLASQMWCLFPSEIVPTSHRKPYCYGSETQLTISHISNPAITVVGVEIPNFQLVKSAVFDAETQVTKKLTPKKSPIWVFLLGWHPFFPLTKKRPSQIVKGCCLLSFPTSLRCPCGCVGGHSTITSPFPNWASWTRWWEWYAQTAPQQQHRKRLANGGQNQRHDWLEKTTMKTMNEDASPIKN